MSNFIVFCLDAVSDFLISDYFVYTFGIISVVGLLGMFQSFFRR